MSRRIGVEEELLLVDVESGLPRAVATTALSSANDDHGAYRGDGGEPGGALEEELQQEQIETDTRPCSTLAEVSAEVRRLRRQAADAAAATGVELAALATSPLQVAPTTTAKQRYRTMVAEFGPTAAEQLSCGCHVHVEVGSDEEGVAALDRIRVWLPVLLALTANSPFHQGRDSGYESYRTQVWNRWPSAGPTGRFGSPERYHRTVEQLVASGSLLDPAMVYFDARLAENYPTVEIRVADVCLDPDDVVLLAALARGLVTTAIDEAKAGVEPPDVRTELLRVAAWRASRSGLEDKLVDPRTWRPVAAGEVVGGLVEHVRPALADSGDEGTVSELLATLLERGTGARRQRRAFERAGDLRDVVRMAVGATTESC